MDANKELAGSVSCERTRNRPARFASESAEVGPAESGEGRIGRTLSFDSLNTSKMESTATTAKLEDLGVIDSLDVAEPTEGKRGAVPKIEALGTLNSPGRHIREVSTCRDFFKSVETERDKPNGGFCPEGLSASLSGPATARQAGPGGGISMARSKSIMTEPDIISGSTLNEKKTILGSAREDVEQRKGDAPQDEIAVQTAGQFLVAELKPSPVYPTTDVVWGQTERDRVYNALIYVPYHLERLVALGNTVCLTSFLAFFTVLPLRVVSALWTGIIISLRKLGIVPKKSGQLSPRLRGDQIFDLISIVIFSVLVLFLWSIKAGAIYFWVKELTQEFLKLSVLHTALELGDKVRFSLLIFRVFLSMKG